MQQLRQYLEDFKTLFSGNTDAYGVHTPEPNPKSGQKAKGRSKTVTAPLTEQHYLKHLYGEMSLGVVPINKEGLVSFATIDVDVYPLNPIKYLTMIKKAKLPFIGFKSKSEGMHLTCFFNPPAKASSVVPLLQQVRDLLGLPKDTELFPKQFQIAQDGTGSWLNLPYYDASKTRRYAYSVDGKELPLSTALNLCMQLRTTPKALRELLDSAPLAEAPPCLQTIFLQGGAEDGARNEFLRSCGVYLKARFGEEFQENLHKLNNNMLDPLDYVELDTTVVSSLNKRDYNYACRSGLLSSHCNREECGIRKYGVGGQYVSDFEFGQLTRYKGEDEDEYYTWMVNETEFTLNGMNDLIKQDRFRLLCGSKLNHIPNRLKENVWLKLINKALSAVVTKDDQISTGLSDKSLWREKVGEFFGTRRGLRRAQLNEGMVYYANGKLYFKAAVLQEYLTKLGTLNNITKQRHMQYMRDFGIKYGPLRVEGRVRKFHYIDLDEQHDKNRLLSIRIGDERKQKENMDKRSKVKPKDDRQYSTKPIEDFKEEEKF